MIGSRESDPTLPLVAGDVSGLSAELLHGDKAQAPRRPLRVQVFSDLHLDVSPGFLPPLAAGADLVIVAGDTREGPRKAFELLRDTIPEPTPIIAIIGNHEHYHGFFDATVEDARRAASEFAITFLENDVAVISGARIAGCTLWTDFCLDGFQRRASAMAQARSGMNDFRRIGWRKVPWERFRPEEAAAVHAASRAFLVDALAEPFLGPTIVVTHHAPHPRSVHPRYEGDPLNPAFTSDLSDLIAAGQPELWIHGHVHDSYDYRVGGTRILCNPKGYGRENPLFDPQLVVEVAR